jgi:hypothetical protein
MLAIAAVMLQIPLVGLRWRCILRALSVPPEKARHAPLIAITAIGAFFAQVLPSVAGEGIRAWLLVRRGCDWRNAATSVVIDRGVGVGLLATLGFVILLLQPGLAALGGYREQVLVVYSVLLLAGLLGLMLLSKIDAVLARWRMSRWIAALAADAHRVLLGPRCPAILALGLLVHALTVTAVWSLGQALGLVLVFADAAVLFVIMVGVTIVPISISGWGLRELAVLTLLGSHGVAPERALLFSVGFGIVLAVGALPGALVWLAYRVAPARSSADE